MTPYYVLKALHLIFVITWFAGLFYIVRLFIYHVEAEREVLQEQFKIMERRLWYGITWPSAILTLILGPVLMFGYYGTITHLPPWLIIKLGLVTLLFLGCSTTILSQTGGIKGFVTNEKDGSAVLYSNVILKGTTYGIATDGNGFYSISKVILVVFKV